MAWIEGSVLNLGFLTSDRKTAVVSLRIDQTEADAWLFALPGVARDGTEVGVLIAAIEALSEGNLLYEEVAHRTTNDAVDYPLPSEEVYSFDKFGVMFSSGLDNYQFTIPARNMAVVVPETDGVTIAITDPPASDEVLALVAAVNDTVLAKNGGAATVTGMRVVS